MKKVFIYVGHSNWGKSMTLKLLTDGSSHKKVAAISSKLIRVSKMSNDEDGKGLLNWVKKFPQLKYQNFIIAYCPKHPITEPPTEEQLNGLDILLELKKTNSLFFFLQNENYNDPTEKLTQDDIDWFSLFGSVQALLGHVESTTRADKFISYIKTNL